MFGKAVANGDVIAARVDTIGTLDVSDRRGLHVSLRGLHNRMEPPPTGRRTRVASGADA